MGCLVLLILLVLVLGVGTVLAVSVVSLLFTLVVAGLVGWAADMVVPGRLPGGWFGAVLSGIIGGFIGTLLFHALGLHDPGFRLFGVDLIPAFVGAVIIAGVAQLLSQRRQAV